MAAGKTVLTVVNFGYDQSGFEGYPENFRFSNKARMIDIMLTGKMKRQWRHAR